MRAGKVCHGNGAQGEERQRGENVQSETVSGRESVVVSRDYRERDRQERGRFERESSRFERERLFREREIERDT